MVGPLESSLELAYDVAQVRVARGFVRTHLESVVPAEIAMEVELIASELVTNAVEHGTPGTLPISITVAVDDRQASITVSSSGESASVGPVEGWQIAAPTQMSGRGLGIVRALSDEIHVSQSVESLTITARRTFARNS